MKNKIYLFRHGQTYYNKNKVFCGCKDSKLTLHGINDAKKIAQKLNKVNIDVAIHTSLSRSKNTLKYVLKFHPECEKKIMDDRMIERSYGELEGKTHKKTIEKYGIEQYERWHRGYSIKNRPPKGECFADVEKRVSKFISWLKNYVKKNKVDVAISAHGNSIRLFRKVMEKLSTKRTVEIKIPHDKVYTYEV